MIPKANPIQFSPPSAMPKFGKLAVGGGAGVGKTHFAATVGKEGKVLYFDVEGGSTTFNSAAFLADEAAAKPENIHSVSFEDSPAPNVLVQRVEGALDYLIASKNEPGYDVVVLDSLTDFQERFLQAMEMKDPRQAYGAFRDALYRIVTKARRVPAHVLFLARLKHTEDPVLNREVVRFELSPSAWGVVSGLFDNIGYMSAKVQGARSERVLDFTFGVRTQGKDRFGLGSVSEPKLTELTAVIEGNAPEKAVALQGPARRAVGARR